MQNETEHPMPRESNARGILILVAAMPPLGLALYALAGPIVAVAVCLVYAAALGVTVIAERRDDMPSRDPATGLPDRAAAVARLEGIFAQRLAGSSQAGVFVISLETAGCSVADADRQATIFMATARLAEGLRRGDQIIRTGENSLAAILGPSRGLTARAAEGILARIDGMFREPIRVGSRSIPVRVSLGACLQHDAPKADAASWIEAAELASQLAAEDGDPRLFPSGATKVDRSAWDEANEPTGEADADALWSAVADCRTDDTLLHTHERRRERA